MKANMKIGDVLLFFRREGMLRTLRATLSYIIGNKKVDFQIQEGGSYTNGQKIVVGIPDLFLKKLSLPEMYAGIIALLGHEAQHVLSSNFEAFSNYNKRMTKYFEKKGVNPAYAGKIVHGVGNSIEDGRIEKIQANRLPGMIKKFQFLNMLYWEHGRGAEGNNLQDVMSAIIMLSVLGIYPRNFKSLYEGTDIYKLVLEIKPLIKEGINAVTCEEGLKVAEKILYKMEKFLIVELKAEEAMDKAMKEFLDSLPSQPNFENSEEVEKNTSGSGGHSTHISESEGEGEGEGKGNSSQGNQPSDGESKSSKGDKDSKEGENKTNSSSNESNNTKTSKDRSKKMDRKSSSGDELSLGEKESLRENNSQSLSEDEIRNKFKEISEGLNEEAKEKFTQIEKKEEEEREKAERFMPLTTKERKELQDEYSQYKLKFVEIADEFSLHRELPADLKNQGKKFRKEVEKIFKNKSTLNLLGQSKGTLNPDDLWRVGMSDYDVFAIEGAKSRSDYVIFILQDGSGSMISEDKDVHSAYALATIEEGLRGVVPFKIATFTAGSSAVIHYKVRGFNDNSKRNHSFNFLHHREAEGGNRDDYSIKVATRELLRRPEKDKVLIVLSDGLPSSKERTKDAIKEARDAKIHVVGIMFGNKSFRDRNIEEYRKMYEKNIIATEPNQIINKLTSTLKKILVR